MGRSAVTYKGPQTRWAKSVRRHSPKPNDCANQVVRSVRVLIDSAFPTLREGRFFKFRDGVVGPTQKPAPGPDGYVTVVPEPVSAPA